MKVMSCEAVLGRGAKSFFHWMALCLLSIAGFAATNVWAAPTISGFSPSSGAPGTAVAVTGTGFSTTAANNTVRFNGTQATVQSATSTQLNVVAPNGGTTGKISVTVGGSTANSSAYYAFPPVITNISPTTASVGTQIAIDGYNFSSIPTVIFTGGVSTAPDTTTGTGILVTVPSGAQTGPVTIQEYGNGLTAASSQVLTIQGPPPTIAGFSPSSGYPSSSVVISGTNFDATPGNNQVTFNSIAATVTAASATSLTVTVPASAPIGQATVAVTVAGQTATSTAFTVNQPPPAQAATFVSANVPASMVAGQSYPVSVTMQNTGSATWTAAQQYRLGEVDTVGWLASQRVDVPSSVAPGQNVTFNFTVTAPTTVRNGYAFSWQMLQEGVAWFGGQFSSQVNVTQPPVVISSFSPTSAPIGATITINGSGFSATASANTVKINGVAAQVTAASTTALSITVPTGASSGPITVAVGTQTGTSGSNFTLIPAITGFSPTSGPANTQVTITGTSFGSLAAVILKLGSQRLTVSSGDNSTLVATIPPGATSGPFTVTNGSGQSGTSAASFTVTLPTITGFSPASGAEGAQVTISGTNFGADASVKFNGVSATVTAVSATSITTTVPSGATSGQLTVTSGGAIATSSNSFTVLPAITSFSPTTGPVGTSVTINGTSFGATTSANTVKFNGVTATVTGAATTWITATVPSNATSGTVSVTVGAQTATSAGSFTVQPTITAISAGSGLAGSSVTLTGTSFSTVASQNSVLFDSTSVTVTAATTTSLTVTVPSNAAAGSHTWSVAVNGVSATSTAAFNVVPSIASFSPTIGPAGTTVTISGTSFSATPSSNTVKFNGTAATVTAASFGSLTTTVPNGATTGAITVAVNGFTATSASNFTVGYPPPTITGFSPTSGPPGTQVTITGTNFLSTATAGSVHFGGAIAPISSGDNTTLVVTVPGTTSGPFTVIRPDSQSATSTNFTVTTPAITSFSPTQGVVGTTVTITGTSFGTTPAANTVMFNGTAATITAASSTSLTVTVPAGAVTGTVSVSTGGLTGTSASTFTVLPAITGFSPTAAPVGASVTISGTNFSATPSSNIVKFNGVTATVTAASTTSLTAVVPSGASSGLISVTVGGQTATSSDGFTVQPVITGISPGSGPPGTTITLTGTSFSATASQNLIQFGSSSIAATTASATSLTINVPSVAPGTYTLTLTVNGVASTNTASFTVTPLIPTISALSPATGTPGTSVTISGANFGTTPAANTVKFNGVAATVTSASATQLQVVVPDTASTGPVVVTTSIGSSNSDAPVNFAAATQGSTAQASSYVTGYEPSGAINGDIKGVLWSNGGVWLDATPNAFPDWLEVDLPTSQTINDVIVYSSQDDRQILYPTDTMTFSQYGLVAFDVQVLSGSTWTTVASVTGNNLVKRRVVFTPVATTAVRVVANASADNASSSIVEVEARNSPADFIVTPKLPTITSVSSLSGPVGTRVAINGTNFGATKGLGNIQFGGRIISDDEPSDWSDTTLIVTVQGTVGFSGPFTVNTTTRQSVTSTQNFTITPTPPSITDFSPTSGPVGTTVVINGSNFDSVAANNTVTFNGTTTTATAVTATSLTVIVPNGTPLGAGAISVRANGITVQSASSYTVTPPPPKITGFQPTNGPIGQTIVITGENFNPDPAKNIVTLGVGGEGFFQPVSAATSTTLTIKLNRMSSTGPFVVSNSAGSDTSVSNFTVWTPYIRQFSPDGGPPGTMVTVYGNYFDPNPANNAVFFGANSPVAPDTVNADGTMLMVRVPSDAIAGSIRIGAYQKLGISTTLFYVTPTITGFSPPSGAVGDSVTITGTNFVDASVVKFNGVVAPITSVSRTSLVVTVPNGATTGRITVTTGGGQSAISATKFIVTGSGGSTAPDRPASVSAGTPTDANVPLTWVPGNSVPAGTVYTIEYSTSASGPWTPVSDAYTGTSATVTVAASGLYYFGVAACSPAGQCSDYTVSAPVNVTVPGTSTTLSLPSADSRDDSVSLVHDETVGTMAGQASTDGGAAQYHVPIVVAPGRAGMQPNLALTYSSRSGNGVMGVGWSISGMSSIHRCPQTPEQDGQTLGVSYTNNDKLCLDGQRLVAVSGTYGSQNTVYRTEIDSYARITQIDGDLATGGATCFRVEEKSGRVLHYGAVTGSITGGVLSTGACAASTAHSRVQPEKAKAADGSAVAIGTLSWLVEKIEDRVGNNQLYKYTDNGNGEVLLDKIKYTGFGTTEGDRTVTFTYVDRTTAASGSNDMSSSYLAGGLTMQTKALQKITTAEPSGTVRTYTPSYTKSLYSGGLMMTGLQECAGDSSPCHAPTQFTYNDSELSFSPTALTGALSGVTTASTGINAQAADIIGIPDLDGDGARETLVFVKESDGDHAFLVQMGADQKVRSAYDMQGAGQMPTFDAAGTAVPPPGTSAWLASPNHYGDMFGDGRSEIIVPPASGSYLTLLSWGIGRGATPSSGTSPFATIQTDVPYQSGPIYGGYGTAIQAVDFDGDGRNDIVFQAPASECGTDTLTIQGFGNPPTSTSTTYVHTGVFVYLNGMTTTPPTSSQTAHFAPISSSTYHTPGLLFCLTLNTNDTGNASQNSATKVEMEHLDRIVDFNGDGRPEFVLSNASVLASRFSRIVSAPKSNGSYATTSAACSDIGLTDGGSFGAAGDECHWSDSTGSIFTTWVDINGDGLDDLVIARPGTPTWQIHLNKGNGKLGPLINTDVSAGLDKVKDRAVFRYVGKLPMMDVDGDGKPDFLIPSSTNKFAMKVCTAVVVPIAGTEAHCPDVSPDVTLSFPIHEASLATGEAPVASNQCVIYNCPEDPGSTTLNLPVNLKEGVFNAYHNVWAAENGDVLPAVGTYSAQGGAVDNSIYHLSQLKFYETSPGVITAKVIETPLISRLVLGVTRAEDVHGNGLASLVTRIGCHAVVKQDSNSKLFNACRTVMDMPGHSYGGPLTLPDGTPTDGATTLADGTQVNGFAVQPLVYINTNKGVSSSNASPQSTVNTLFNVGSGNCPLGPVLPGLLASATNGLNDTAQWGYDSLALGRLCTRDGVAEYSTADSAGNDAYYGDKRHYYFASSMPVVSAMLQSNGVSGMTGSRSAIYGYGQAMYNHYGRGFQGFRSISVENATATTDSARRLITTTTFNQKFPLVGTAASVVTRVAPSNSTGANPQVSVSYSCTQADGSTGSCTAINPVHIETSTYQCASAICSQGDSLVPPTASAPFQPVLSVQSSFDYDLNTSAPSSHSRTDNTNWDAYGNLGNQIVTRSDDTSGGQFIASHVTSKVNTFASDTASWWLDKLSESTITSTITYAGGHSLPVDTSAPARSIDTQYIWNTDRTPLTKTVQSGVGGQQSTTTYTYPSPSYGLPASVAINAPDLGAALSPTRYTEFGYSTDGYFVQTTTKYPQYSATNKGTGQITTIVTRARDGQAAQVRDPNNILVATTYDAFGRATMVEHKDNNGVDIEKPIHSAYCNIANAVHSAYCPANAIGEDDLETYAAYRVTTTQIGAPTKVVWADVLGRPVKQGEMGFSSTSSNAPNYTFIATFTDYDSNGTTMMQSTPYFISGGGATLTTYTYDALNRVTKKVAPTSCSGSGTLSTAPYGAMTTTYDYVGRQTNITASGSSCFNTTLNNGAIKMSRSTNVLGQLMQTIDANGNTDFNSGKTTSYWTEPMGHVVAIRDVQNNVTSATYNALGQRTQSVDPNQGTWNFTYDALGELLTQTDARNVTTTITSRDALGRVLSKQAVPLANSPASNTGEAILDTYSYDPTNAIGLPGLQSRYRGTNLSDPASNPLVWQQSPVYDLQARPSTITTTINEGTLVNFTSRIDYDSAGRVAKHTYPNVAGTANGLVVQHSYTAYGQLDALSNFDTGSVYWTAQAANEWGHVTQEAFPGIINGNHSDWPSTGQARMLNWGGSNADRFDYIYDSFGNVTNQQRQTNGATVSESYVYDSLQRLKSSTRVPADGGHPPVTYSYSDSGNILSKSDWALAYTYGGTCGPHFATVAGSATYTCDANGNVVGGNTLTAVYDAENRPKTIQRAQVGSLTQAGNMRWGYSGTGQIDFEHSGSSQGDRYFGPDGYEQVGAGAAAKQTHELGPVIVTRTNNGLGSYTDSISVVLRDRLGSTMSVIEDGGTPTTRAYDAFGKARNGDFGDRQNGTLNLFDNILGNGLVTIHGFTKHDHADDVALIHMGGRVYDYNLGRFLQVDPIIQNPANSQSLNPYSYVGNNPLSGIDPTGYATCDVKQTVGTGEGQCNFDAGSDNKIYDGDKYLGKVNANGSGTATSFAATAAGFSYMDAHASGATAGQTPHGEATPTGQPTHDASSLGGVSTSPNSATVGSSLPSLPYAVGVDPNSNLNLDQQAARWMGPGVGFAQCATGAVKCSGAETFNQAVVGGIQVAGGQLLNFFLGKFVSWAAGDVVGNAASNEPQFTFRGDSRGPDDVFKNGFTSRGTSTDLMAHAMDNTRPPSAFISTSRSADVAGSFAQNIYVVRPTSGINVNQALGRYSPFPGEQEIAVPWRIPASDVRAVTLPNQNMSLLNPNWKP